MADVNRGNRPLSPHLGIYRPQWTSISSIFVRITGIGLLVTATLVVAWLLAAASSEAAFASMDWFMRSFIGDLILFVSVGAFVYHMLGRLRHVIWDLGYCVEVEVSELMAKGMVAISIIAAVLAAIAL